MSALEELIPIVNKLQDLVFNTIGTDTLDLPQVVVVGSQSCGKTSVLENIVGRDFLPRGSGIVTRRPLILQLINISDSNTSDKNSSSSKFENIDEEDTNNENQLSTTSSSVMEWGEFLHLPGRKFTNFQDIRREIENETARLAGNNKGISRQPINLKVYSPNVLNLTLVDLPGLTKIPIGDQPSDIEKQTRVLILEYIAKPNSIILAVSPANVDLVNSESLKLARHVDPEGKRTVGVLTKLDLMDHGTNALDILSGRVYPLKLGFIGVVNRSQQDLQIGASLKESLKRETEFFKTHPVYRNISNRCGTKFLEKTLNQILMSHIREKLPDIKAKLNTLMGQTEQELASYGDNKFSGKSNRGTLILQLMTKFATKFITSIDGTSADISIKELSGGARIYYIYNDVFGNSLCSINPTSNLSVSDIRTAIRNSTGPRPSLFVPEFAFDLLVKPQIHLLESPSQRCVELVYEELMKICHNCGSHELSRYPKLQAKLIEVVSDLLRERLGPTSNYVESLIDIQRAYINTNHPNFLGAAAAMSSVLQSSQEREKEKRIRDIRRAQKENAIAANPASGSTSLPNNNKDGETAVSGVENGSIDQIISSATDNLKISNGTITDSKHDRAYSMSSSTDAFSNSNQASKESFLNYFFGKDNQQNGSLNSANNFGIRNNSLQHNKKNSKAQVFDSIRSAPELQSDKIDPIAFPDYEGNNYDSMGSLNSDEEQLSERELLEVELIRKLIISYFNIVRETIQDQVPKAVMHLLVNHSKEAVQNRLVSELYKESLFDDLLHEDDSLVEERNKCEKLLGAYRDAARIVSEVV